MPALSAPAVIPASPSIGRTDGLRESDSDTPFQDVAGNQGDDGATAYQQDGDPPAKSTPRARPGTATPRRRSKARVAVTTDIAIPPRRSKARAAVMTVTAIPPRPSKARAAVMTITAMPPRPSKVRAAVTTATAIRPDVRKRWQQRLSLWQHRRHYRRRQRLSLRRHRRQLRGLRPQFVFRSLRLDLLRPLWRVGGILLRHELLHRPAGQDDLPLIVPDRGAGRMEYRVSARRFPI
jgi:hypothetical protein